MTRFEIVDLVVPEHLGADPDAEADFRAMVAVRNAVMEDAIGADNLNAIPAELWVHWQPSEFETVRGFVAKVDGKVVGRTYAIVSPDPEAQDVECTVEVIPEFRRRGIGAALYERMIAAVRELHRTILQGDFYASAESSGETIASPTGFGSMPADDAAVRFALARGFTLEQVERYSMLTLPVGDDALRALLGGAAVEDAYSLVSWAGATPDEWLDDIAHLHSRMRTDAPSGALELSEQVWNADRVRQLDSGRLAAGQTTLTTVARHAGSDKLVGLTELVAPAEISRPVMQNDTLVLREHRGHRLGMILKLANLRFLQDARPGHPFVQTFNAEENRPMLNVNEAIGFVPRAYGGMWKKVLSE